MLAVVQLHLLLFISRLNKLFCGKNSYYVNVILNIMLSIFRLILIDIAVASGSIDLSDLVEKCTFISSSSDSFVA